MGSGFVKEPMCMRRISGVLMPQTNDLMAQEEQKEREEHNHHSRRVAQIYGVHLADYEDMPRQTWGIPQRRLNIIVNINGESKEMAVFAMDSAVNLKIELHESSPEDVAPPVASTLLFGGLEIRNLETFEDHDVEAGSILYFTYEPGMKITLDSFMTSRYCVLWGNEQVVTAFRRLQAQDRAWEWENGDEVDYEAFCSQVFVGGSQLRPNRHHRQQWGSVFSRALVY